MYFRIVDKKTQRMNHSSLHFRAKSVILISFNLTFFTFAQNKAEKAIERFSQDYPQEKIHLLLNKKDYVAGENLWFTSFVFNGYSPSSISTNIFVELYDRNKKQISRKIYPLINGRGSGNISLPENLKEDLYYIRAYTTWMGNFSDDFNTIQPVAVYNPLSPQKLEKDTVSAWSAAAFPESGTFIDGISTKFAVRLQSEGQTPSQWNGYITEMQNPEQKIVTFDGFDQNTGVFTITPAAGKKYRMTVSDRKGNKQTVNLPEVLPSGINLQVESFSDIIKLRLKSKNTPPEARFKIIGTMNNQLVCSINISKISDKQYAIPADKLVNGILTLTVFDGNENIVAQRLCFVQPEKLRIKKPAFQDMKVSLEPRHLNSFNIVNVQKVAYYTVAVSDSETESLEDENSLPSTLWLTGDISSKIYSPAQYFTKNSNAEALDALLITEKWSRFNWQAIMSGTFPVIRYKPESYLSYTGKVMTQGKPAAETEFNLMYKIPGQGLQVALIKTDKNGLFGLNNLIFEDSMLLSYQPNKEKTAKNALQVYLQPAFSFLPLKSSLPDSGYRLVNRQADEKMPKQVARALSTQKTESFFKGRFAEIEEVTIQAKKRNLTQELNDKLSSAMFSSGDELIFDFVNDNNLITSSGNILQWLQGRAPGVQIMMNGANPAIMYRGSRIPVFVDEFKVEVSDISSISPSDVAMIKFIRNNFMGTSGGAVGAIVIYTRRGDEPKHVLNSTLPSVRNEIKISGYDKVAPFISEVYNNEDFRSAPEDQRNVLFWNPYLENNGSTFVKWYNNDDAKAFKVIMIGFDENNDPFYYNEVLK